MLYLTSAYEALTVLGRWQCSQCCIKTGKVGDTLIPLDLRYPRWPGCSGRSKSHPLPNATARATLTISLFLSWVSVEDYCWKNCKVFSNTTALGSKVLAVKAVFYFIAPAAGTLPINALRVNAPFCL